MATANWVDAIIGFVVFVAFYGILDLILFLIDKNAINALPEELKKAVWNHFLSNIGKQFFVVLWVTAALGSGLGIYCLIVWAVLLLINGMAIYALEQHPVTPYSSTFFDPKELSLVINSEYDTSCVYKRYVCNRVVDQGEFRSAVVFVRSFDYYPKKLYLPNDRCFWIDTKVLNADIKDGSWVGNDIEGLIEKGLNKYAKGTYREVYFDGPCKVFYCDKKGLTINCLKMTSLRNFSDKDDSCKLGFLKRMFNIDLDACINKYTAKKLCDKAVRNNVIQITVKVSENENALPYVQYDTSSVTIPIEFVPYSELIKHTQYSDSDNITW